MMSPYVVMSAVHEENDITPDLRIRRRAAAAQAIKHSARKKYTTEAILCFLSSATP